MRARTKAIVMLVVSLAAIVVTVAISRCALGPHDDSERLAVVIAFILAACTAIVAIVILVIMARRRTAILYVLGGLSLVGVNLALVRVFVEPLWAAREARDWVQTTCTIEGTDTMVEHDSKGRSTEWLRVSYHFYAGGVATFSDRVDFADLRDASRFAPLEGIRDRSTLPCWYDPAAPSSSVLDRTGWPSCFDLWRGLAMLVALSGLLTWPFARVNEGAAGVAALGVRVLSVVPLTALAVLAPSGGASASSGAVLEVLAIVAWGWAVYTVRAWRRAREPALPGAQVV